MQGEGVIASDATKNEFHDQLPNGVSTVSVAVAVENVNEFEDRYFDIIRSKIDKYNLKVEYPIIKDKHISRWVTDWKREEARREIVGELLQIDALDTILVAETYLQPRWIEMYHNQEDEHRRETSHKFVSDILTPYYNTISIWKYLDTYGGGQNTHYNVMTDDFTGQVCEAWENIGEWAERFAVVPQGDRTYPVLAMADLLIGLIKQEVYPLKASNVKDKLVDDIGTAAYVRTESIYEGDELRKMTPHSTDSIRTELHYPDPTIYLKRGKRSTKKIKSLDFFDQACIYAHAKNGCVKFFEENLDRHHLSNEDIIVCMDGDTEEMMDYQEMNSRKSASVMTIEQATETFLSNIPDDLAVK